MLVHHCLVPSITQLPTTHDLATKVSQNALHSWTRRVDTAISIGCMRIVASLLEVDMRQAILA